LKEPSIGYPHRGEKEKKMLSNEDLAKLIALMDSAGYRVMEIGRADPSGSPYQTAHMIIFARQDPKQQKD